MSPEDRFIVKDDITNDKVWWGNINIPFDPDKFEDYIIKLLPIFRKRSLCKRLLCVCRPNYKLNIRVINEYPWSNHVCL